MFLFDLCCAWRGGRRRQRVLAGTVVRPQNREMAAGNAGSVQQGASGQSDGNADVKTDMCVMEKEEVCLCGKHGTGKTGHD